MKKEKRNQRVAATVAPEHRSLWQFVWHSRGSETSSRSNRKSSQRWWRNPERVPLISCSLMESISSDGQQGLYDVLLSGGRFTCSTGGRKENSVTIIEKRNKLQGTRLPGPPRLLLIAAHQWRRRSLQMRLDHSAVPLKWNGETTWRGFCWCFESEGRPSQLELLNLSTEPRDTRMSHSQ